MKYPGRLVQFSSRAVIYKNICRNGVVDTSSEVIWSASKNEVCMIISTLRNASFVLGVSYAGWTGVYKNEFIT